MNDKTYRIPEVNWEKFCDKIQDVNRKAQKLGVAEVVVTELGREIKTFEHRTHHAQDEATVQRFKMQIMTVKVEGDTPRLNGWSFVAVIAPLPGGHNVVRVVPGEELPENYRDGDHSVCEHCNARRPRKYGYVVRHESGQYRQVGSTCLGDFLGSNAHNPEAVAEMAFWMASDYEEFERVDVASEFGAMNVQYHWIDFEGFMAYVAMVVRVEGRFVTVQQAKDSGDMLVSTSRLAVNAMYERNPLMMMSPQPQDHETAVKVVAWAKTMQGDTDYARNVRSIADAGVFEYNCCGIAASAMVCWMRQQERDRIAAASPEVLDEYFGQVGQRVKGVAVTVVKIKNTEFSTMVRMVAKTGHRLTWFASGSVGMQEGQEAEIAATVKKHDDYRGQKSTIVTRVKVQDQGVAS